jgi:hypothetical protein
MRCEGRMRKSDLRETRHAHLGVDVFENALRQENQPDRNADERDKFGSRRPSEGRLIEYYEPLLELTGLYPGGVIGSIWSSAAISATVRIRPVPDACSRSQSYCPVKKNSV